MSRAELTSNLPVEITERIKNIDNIYKIVNTKLTPISKSYPLISSDAPRAEIYFPNDAILYFANAILEAEITFNHRGNAAAGSANNYVQSVYPPRYGLASLIQELNIYLNGQTISKTSQYAYIHNWIKDWLQTFDVEIIDNGLNTVDDPSKLYSYQNGNTATMKGYVVPRRGFPASNSVADADINTRLKNKYHMNLSDSVGFFGEASSKIINTAVLGELKLEIIFTSQIASCILGSSVPAATPVYSQVAATFEDQNNSNSTTLLNNDVDISANALSATTKLQRRINIQKFTANFTTGDAGIPTAGNADASFNSVGTGGAIAADATQIYSISNIVLHIEALQFKTRDYYDVMNKLVESGNYRYHFKKYVLYNDAPTTSRQIDYRMIVNSECVNYVLATFRPNGFNTIANPVNTLISPVSAGHTGVYQATIDNQIAAGLPHTFNNSNFFIRNGQKISRLGFKVDDTLFEPRTNQEMYIDNLRHWRNYLPGVESRPYKGLKNIYDFINCFYTGILSFETKSDDDMKWVYPLRGLNTNGKQIAISAFTEVDSTAVADAYTAQAGDNSRGFSTIDLDPGNAATPTFLVCTTNYLVLNGRRNVDLKY
jgi:hypothetical protein